MIVYPPFSYSLLPGLEPNQRLPSRQSPGAEQRQNPDFLAEMLKLSLNASAIQSFGDLPQHQGSPSADPMAQLMSGASSMTSTSKNASGTNAVPRPNSELLLQAIAGQSPDTLSKTVLDALAPMLLGSGAPGVNGTDALSHLLAQSKEPSQGPLTGSLVGSPAALVALIQSVVEQAPPAKQPPPTNPSTLRRAITAYTPRYSAEGLRQKIDFAAQHLSSPADHGAPGRQAPDVQTGMHAKHPPVQAAIPLQVREILPGGGSGSPAVLPGVLAARFESANRPDAVGYDRRGGTCYGTYQISSRMGGMEAFLSYLETEAPQWAKRLREAGPANTQGRNGAMPSEWKRIHREAPERFAALQHDFTRKNYYEPAARLVSRRTGLNPEQASPALREVLWSTAVQHGVSGAANIFQRALDTVSVDGPPRESELIQAVYDERKTRFTGSTQSVRSAVQSRFEQEMQLALALLPEERDVLV